jgi:hypothetical protein
MDERDPTASRRSPRLRPCWVLASGSVIVALIVVGIVGAQQVTQMPPANTDYSVAIAPGVRPVTSNGRITAIARSYLDAQTPEIEGEHQPPVVITAAAMLARDARQVEPGIPAAPVAAQPGRIVWIVRASGDFLILRDLPWSSSGTPYPSGNIVIDDATGPILGVYPHAAGECTPSACSGPGT